MMPWYEDFAENKYSQYGEDGILEEIFRRCEISQGLFVEFGAWDGIRYSNSYNLLVNHGWAGVYIEGDPERFQDLERNVRQGNVLKLCAFVACEGEASLDAILAGHDVFDDVALLSIDIDSDDYAVWEGLKNYHPLVVVVEYNPIIPLDTEYVQERGRNIGNSALSLFRLGRAKGYAAVAMTETNLIFVRDDTFPKLGVEMQSLEQLSRGNTRFRIFYGYDGTLVHVGPERFTGNPWQMRVPMQLPRCLRYYGHRSGPLGLLKTLFLRLMLKLVR